MVFCITRLPKQSIWHRVLGDTDHKPATALLLFMPTKDAAVPLNMRRKENGGSLLSLLLRRSALWKHVIAIVKVRFGGNLCIQKKLQHLQMG